MKECWLCGYKLGGNSAKFHNHHVHVGCLEQHLKAKEITRQRLDKLMEEGGTHEAVKIANNH
jgi:hypothetical protein